MKIENFSQLKGFQGTILDLSNELVRLGCEDIGFFAKSTLVDCLTDGSIVVSIDEAGDEYIVITFYVMIINSNDEDVLAALIEITDISEY